LVEFEDGHRIITSRHAVRKAKELAMPNTALGPAERTSE
jgi:hypothetical protein